MELQPPKLHGPSLPNRPSLLLTAACLWPIASLSLPLGGASHPSVIPRKVYSSRLFFPYEDPSTCLIFERLGSRRERHSAHKLCSAPPHQQLPCLVSLPARSCCATSLIDQTKSDIYRGPYVSSELQVLSQDPPLIQSLH